MGEGTSRPASAGTGRYRGLPLVASTADLERDGGFRAQDRLFVADRVVAAVVRRESSAPACRRRRRRRPAARARPGRRPVHRGPVDVTVPYGAPVPGLADALRPLLVAALDDLLGPA